MESGRDTVRLAVIGCGGIAQHQLNSVWDLGRFELVAGADIRPGQLDLFTEKFGLQRGYADYREMLAKESGNLDAVMVCTPTFLHAEHTIAAAEAGLPVFCQKPMAMNSYDCYKVMRACDAAGVSLQIGFVRRFDTDWGTLKRVIESGRLGAPVLWRQTAGGPGPRRPFFMDKFEGGGPMIDGMVHNYDFAAYCFGEPVEVKSMPIRIHKSTTAWDTGTVLVRFERGDAIMCSWSWGLPPGVSTPGRTEVLGPNGVLYFPGSYDPAKVRDRIDPEHEGAYLLVLEGGKEEVVPFKKQNMFREEMKHFADWVLHGGRPRVGGQAGLRAVRVAELALSGGGLV